MIVVGIVNCVNRVQRIQAVSHFPSIYHAITIRIRMLRIRTGCKFTRIDELISVRVTERTIGTVLRPGCRLTHGSIVLGIQAKLQFEHIVKPVEICVDGVGQRALMDPVIDTFG